MKPSYFSAWFVTVFGKSATPGAYIKPGLVRRPLCHKVNLPSYVARRTLCHKVNLPSCVAQQPLCHKVKLPSCVAWRLSHKVNIPSWAAQRPLCHKVNLPRCEARRHHFIMTCDVFGSGQTNILAPCYLFRKTYKPAYSRATQVTEINSLNQITEKGKYWREHTHSTGGFDDSLEMCERCSVSEPVFKHNSLCSSVHHKKCGLGSV